MALYQATMAFCQELRLLVHNICHQKHSRLRGSSAYSPSSSSSAAHSVRLSLNNSMIIVESLYDASSSWSRSPIASANAVLAIVVAFSLSLMVSYKNTL